MQSIIWYLMECFDLPPLTTPLVQMADMERPVMVVTTQLRAMTTVPKPEMCTNCYFQMDTYNSHTILVKLFVGKIQTYSHLCTQSQRGWGCRLSSIDLATASVLASFSKHLRTKAGANQYIFEQGIYTLPPVPLLYLYSVHTVSHKGEYSPHVFVSVLLYQAKMAHWTQSGHFHLGVYALMLPAVLATNSCVTTS